MSTTHAGQHRYRAGSGVSPFFVSSLSKDKEGHVGFPTPLDLTFAELKRAGESTSPKLDGGGNTSYAEHPKVINGGNPPRLGQVHIPFVPHVFGQGVHGFSAADNIIVALNTGGDLTAGDVAVFYGWDATIDVAKVGPPVDDNDPTAVVAKHDIKANETGLFYASGVCRVNLVANADTSADVNDPIGILADSSQARVWMTSIGHIVALDGSDVYARIGCPVMQQLVKVTNDDGDPYDVTVLDHQRNETNIDFTEVTNIPEVADPSSFLSVDDEGTLIYLSGQSVVNKYINDPRRVMDIAKIESGTNPYTATRQLFKPDSETTISLENKAESTGYGFLQSGNPRADYVFCIKDTDGNWVTAYPPSRMS